MDTPVPARFDKSLTAEEALTAFLTPPKSADTYRESELLQQSERSFIRSGGEDIAVYAWGEGPPVLLLHGWGGRAWQFAAFVAPLTAARFRVVGLDGPGHGRSGGTLSSAPAMAAAAVQIGVREGIFAGVVGHSIGATAATIAMTQGLQADSAVFLGACCWTMPVVTGFCELHGLDARTEQALKRTIWKRYDERLLAADLLAPQMTAQLLLFHDPGDPEISCAHSQALLNTWPHAVLRETPGQGHRRIMRDRSVVQGAVEFITANALSEE